jgi:hypothetical protein
MVSLTLAVAMSDAVTVRFVVVMVCLLAIVSGSRCACRI